MAQPLSHDVGEELHRLSRRLQESEARKAAVLESALDCIVIMDEHGLIVEFNPAAEKVFGYRRQDVLGKPVAELIVPTHLRAAHWRGLEHYLATGEGPVLGRRIEMPAIRSDGREFPVELAIAVTKLDSGRAIFTAYLRDITERVRAAEMLRNHHQRQEAAVRERTAELERTHQHLRWSERLTMLGTLAAGLGHDLGNLLMPMRIRLEAMRAKDVASATDRALADDLDSLEHSLVYLQRLANGLRMLASGVSPKSSAVQATELREWWADAESILRNVLPRGVALVAEFDEGVSGVLLSPPLLMQVVFNLVQNAGEALGADARGRVVIWAKTAPVECNQSISGVDSSPRDRRHFIVLGVTDNGPGMTSQVQERCVEPHFSSKAGGAGSGMGLALVKEIVEVAGGRMQVKSEPGRGATIVVELPASNG